MTVTEKVRHRGQPAEPFATPGAFGRITRTYDEGPFRVTPAARGIPAQAYVDWDGYQTWENLNDLIFIPERKRD